MRDMKLFTINDDDNENRLLIDNIHNERGYKRLRESLSKMYNRDYTLPNIQVFDVDVKGDRCLTLAYYPYDGRELNRSSARETLECVRHIWGYHTKLVSLDSNGSKSLIFDLIQ